MRSLFNSNINLPSKVLDMYLERQNVIMSNIANVDTQDYRPRKVEFEKKLQDALGLDVKGKVSRTNSHHMPGSFDINGFDSNFSKELKPRIIYGEDRVNLDQEMVLMAKTNLQYNALTTVIRSSFEGLRNVIAEGQK